MAASENLNPDVMQETLAEVLRVLSMFNHKALARELAEAIPAAQSERGTAASPAVQQREVQKTTEQLAALSDTVESVGDALEKMDRDAVAFMDKLREASGEKRPAPVIQPERLRQQPQPNQQQPQPVPAQQVQQGTPAQTQPRKASLFDRYLNPEDVPDAEPKKKPSLLERKSVEQEAAVVIPTVETQAAKLEPEPEPAVERRTLKDILGDVIGVLNQFNHKRLARELAASGTSATVEPQPAHEQEPQVQPAPEVSQDEILRDLLATQAAEKERNAKVLDDRAARALEESGSAHQPLPQEETPEPQPTPQSKPRFNYETGAGRGGAQLAAALAGKERQSENDVLREQEEERRKAREWQERQAEKERQQAELEAQVYLTADERQKLAEQKENEGKPAPVVKLTGIADVLAAQVAQEVENAKVAHHQQNFQGPSDIDISEERERRRQQQEEEEAEREREAKINNAQNTVIMHEALHGADQRPGEAPKGVWRYLIDALKNLAGITEKSTEEQKKGKKGQVGTALDMAAAGFQQAQAGIMSMVSAASPLAFDTFTQSLKLLSATIGQVFLPYIMQASKWIQDIASWFRDLSQATKDSIASIAKWSMLGLALVYVGAKVVSVFTMLFNTISAGLSLAMSPFLMKILLITGAVTALVYAIGRLTGYSWKDMFGGYDSGPGAKSIDEMTDALQRTGKINWSQIREVFGEEGHKRLTAAYNTGDKDKWNAELERMRDEYAKGVGSTLQVMEPDFDRPNERFRRAWEKDDEWQEKVDTWRRNAKAGNKDAADMFHRKPSGKLRDPQEVAEEMMQRLRLLEEEPGVADRVGFGRTKRIQPRANILERYGVPKGGVQDYTDSLIERRFSAGLPSLSQAQMGEGFIQDMGKRFLASVTGNAAKVNLLDTMLQRGAKPGVDGKKEDGLLRGKQIELQPQFTALEQIRKNIQVASLGESQLDQKIRQEQRENARKDMTNAFVDALGDKQATTTASIWKFIQNFGKAPNQAIGP